MANHLVIVAGPTGVGKTDTCIELAKCFNTFIISADSRQLYKELHIGVARPSEKQLADVQHYFIASRSIHQYYNVSKYEIEVIELLDELFKEKRIILLTGGSMLYIDAVCKGIDDFPEIDQELRKALIVKLQNEGIESLRFELGKLDPEYYAVVDLKNKSRLLRALEVCLMTGKPYSSFRTSVRKPRNFIPVKIALTRKRQELYDRINCRVLQMMEQGLLAEAFSLFPHQELPALKTVGYRELFEHFRGNITLEQAIEKIQDHTRNYARKQLTWLKKDKEYAWFHHDEKLKIIRYIEEKTSGYYT